MKYKTFFKNWLLHSIALWLLINIADVFTFLTAMDNNGTPAIGLRYRFINHNIHQAIWIEILIFCFAAECNYHIVFQKFRFSVIKFAAFSIVLSLLFTGSLMVYSNWLSNYFLLSSFLSVPVIYLLYTGTYIFIRNYFEANKAKAEQLQQKTAAELNALKAQLNPHFFFNTLNTIYGTALEENAPRTAETIDKLSSLVRYVMEKTHREIVTVQDEINFAEDYFQLQQQRIPLKSNIHITKQILCDNPSLMVAPLLFLPFMENAFKYGISIDKECFIKLRLAVSGRHAEMMIENSIIQNSAVKAGEGTGIINATKRLQLIYPQAHKLIITKEDNIFHVHLSIEL